jgi:hypothetical protein
MPMQNIPEFKPDVNQINSGMFFYSFGFLGKNRNKYLIISFREV